MLGIGDMPPVHKLDEIKYFDNDEDPMQGIPEEDLTPAQIKIRKERKETFAILQKPKLQVKGY